MSKLTFFLTTRFFGMVAGLTLVVIAIMVTFRLESLAQLVVVNAPFKDLVLFFLLQLPYFLPIVIPVSVLLTTFLISRQLSDSYQLVALRSAGLSLRSILKSVLFSLALLTFANIFLVVYLAPYTSSFSKTLFYNALEQNPIDIFKQPELLRRQGMELHHFSDTNPDHGYNLLALSYPQKGQGMALLIFSELQHTSKVIDKKKLQGENVALFSSKNNVPTLQQFKRLSLSFEPRPQHLSKSPPLDHQTVGNLLEKMEEGGGWPETLELIRRLSLGFAPFSFGVLGLYWGLRTGRGKPLAPIFVIATLSILSLVSFFFTKSLYKDPVLAIAFNLAPQFLMCTAAFWRARSIEKGASV